MMGHCKYRVMDMCTKYGRRPCISSPECFEPEREVITNGDRIRLMSDEELAAFLCNIQKACEPCKACVASDHCRAGNNGFIDWLQQPAQEEQQ